MLGPNDLKIYAEAAVLGVKDYAGYYNDILERIPVMVGINLPMFKLVDFLAIEGEYYASPWRNVPTDDKAAVPYNSFEFDTTEGIWRMDSPDKGAGEKGKTDNLKWALIGEKTIKRFTIRAKIASDHLGYPTGDGLQDTSERLLAPSEWYWQLTFMARL
jgi:hypothetical protein